MSVPKLRFTEFNLPYKLTELGDALIGYSLGGNYANSCDVTSNPLIKMGNLGRGYINTEKVEYIQNNERITDDNKLEIGDLLFNTRNTLDLVGKVAIWRGELERAYFNSNIMRMVFDNNYYMNYALNTKKSLAKLKAIASGTTSVAAIYTKDLKKLKIWIPSINEQTKIGDFLSSVDDKVTLLNKQYDLLCQYKKGMMQKIFNQEVRFRDENGDIFPAWQENTLSNLGNAYSGLTGKTAEDFGKGTFYITYKQIFDNRIIQPKDFGLVCISKNEKQNKVKYGDLFFTTSSETPDEVAFCSVFL
ncbi:TPA: hypothetical protein J1A37_003851, partial [Escherichia coli]|nr:hypothetical protein [Escherichia coli]